MEQVLKHEETPLLALRSVPAWVLSSQFTKIKLTLEGLNGHPL